MRSRPSVDQGLSCVFGQVVPDSPAFGRRHARHATEGGCASVALVLGELTIASRYSGP